MNPSAQIIPEAVKFIHNCTHKIGKAEKSVDREDEIGDSLSIQWVFRMQTVGKWVRSP